MNITEINTTIKSGKNGPETIKNGTKQVRWNNIFNIFLLIKNKIKVLISYKFYFL